MKRADDTADTRRVNSRLGHQYSLYSDWKIQTDQLKILFFNTMAPEDSILALMESLTTVDFAIVGQGILLMFGILWGFLLLWVWSDSGERTTNLFFRILMVLFVSPLNIPGLIIYFLVRPTHTIEQVYWADLERKYLVYETSELDDCGKCGHGLMPGFNNCPRCGDEVKIKCEQCEVMVDRDYKYCPFCGLQHRKRAAVEAVIDQEAMEESIEERRAEVVEAVENKGTRFVRRGGLAEKVGSSFVNVFKSFKKARKENSKVRAEKAKIKAEDRADKVKVKAEESKKAKAKAVEAKKDKAKAKTAEAKKAKAKVKAEESKKAKIRAEESKKAKEKDDSEMKGENNSEKSAKETDNEKGSYVSDNNKKKKKSKKKR